MNSSETVLSPAPTRDHPNHFAWLLRVFSFEIPPTIHTTGGNVIIESTMVTKASTTRHVRCPWRPWLPSVKTMPRCPLHFPITQDDINVTQCCVLLLSRTFGFVTCRTPGRCVRFVEENKLDIKVFLKCLLNIWAFDIERCSYYGNVSNNIYETWRRQLFFGSCADYACATLHPVRWAGHMWGTILRPGQFHDRTNSPFRFRASQSPPSCRDHSCVSVALQWRWCLVVFYVALRRVAFRSAASTRRPPGETEREAVIRAAGRVGRTARRLAASLWPSARLDLSLNTAASRFTKTNSACGKPSAVSACVSTPEVVISQLDFLVWPTRM